MKPTRARCPWWGEIRIVLSFLIAGPDTGLIYPRVRVPLGDAGNLLGWGEPGRALAAAPAVVASGA
jgi:hypothetical protein